MRNLLALAAAAVLAFIVVGWFRGWYQVSSKPSATGREYDVNFNRPKIAKDLETGEEKVRDFVNEKVKQTSHTQPTGDPVHQTVVPGSPPNSFKTAPDGSLVYPGTPNTPPPPASPAVPPQ